VDDGRQMSSKPGEVIEFDELEGAQLTGNRPVRDIVPQPSRAKIPQVTKLCQAPAVAMRSFEGVDRLRVGLLSLES
jgi:hypothetical protein